MQKKCCKNRKYRGDKMSNNKKSDEENARKNLENQILQAYFSEMQQQMSEIENKKAELEYLMDGLSQMKGQKGKDILIPLGSGVLAKGSLSEDEKVIVNVGSNILIKKTVEEAKKIIENQIKELSSIVEQLEGEMTKYSQLQ